MYAASVVILAVAYILFYIYLAPIHNVIVIGFDGFHGLNLLGTTGDVFAILASGAVLLAINGGLTAVFAARDRFFATLIPFVSLFISILILISVGGTIAIN